MPTPKKKPTLPPPPFDDTIFPPLDDEPLDDAEVVALRDAAAHPAVDLQAHDPGQISGAQYTPSPMGAGFPFQIDPTAATGTTHGRPSAPRIWTSALLHENVSQLRVWRKFNGVPTLIGVIDKDATEEDFIRTFIDSMPRPGEGDGRFIVRPIDREGNEIREEITLPPISENHTLLRQLRASSAPLAAPAQSGSTSAIQETMLQFLLNRTDQVERQTREEREGLKSEAARLAELNIAASQRGALSVEAITERMMAAEAQRAQQAQATEAARSDQMIQMMRLQAEAAAQDFQRRQAEEATRRAAEIAALEAKMRADRDELALRLERERIEAQTRIDRERQEYDRRWERERAENEARQRREDQAREDRQKREDQLLEIRREAEERNLRAAEAERQRQHEARMKEMDQAAAREREHADRRLAQEREYQERLVRMTLENRHSDTLEGTLDKVTGTLGKLGIDPKKLINGILEPPESGPPVAEVVGSVLTAGLGALGQYLQGRAAVDQAKAQSAKPPTVPAIPLLPPPVPVSGGDILFGAQAAQPQAAAPAAVQPQAPAAPPKVEEAPGPPGAESLPLPTRREARTGFRKLAKMLASASPDLWHDGTIDVYQGTPACFHYAKAITLRAALTEAGANPQQVDAYLAHPASAVFPAEIPRG